MSQRHVTNPSSKIMNVLQIVGMVLWIHGLGNFGGFSDTLGTNQPW